MAKLYIMCGLAFSGKSTLAKQIVAHTNSKLIAFDTLWVEKEKEQLLPKDSSGWRLIRRVGQEQIIQVLKDGISVVYDDNNVRFEHREEIRNIAKQLHIENIVVYLNTPMAVIKQREADNKLTGERHEVDPINFQTAIDQLQVPSSEEKVIVFQPDDNLEDWLKHLDNSLL